MLDALLAPMTREVFFREYWTKSFLHIPGEPSKFTHFFTWEVLSKALEEHRFEERRLKLVRSGATIEAGCYLDGQMVNSAGLLSQLAAGATLIFNQCEEVHRPLRDLCEYLESLFHHRVIANLYAGWRSDNGFPVHWDDQDVLILQLAGRKRWEVWEPTRAFPFKKDVVDTSTPPTANPLWEGVLETGGLLSIPRGWWHVAYPLGEPSLHLTVTVKNYNGIDLLHWLADSMKASEAARKELPLVATPEEQDRWLAEVRKDLLATFDAELMRRFLYDKDSEALPRPVLSLRDDVPARINALTENAPVGRNTPLELAMPGPIYMRIENGRASCRARAMKWEVDRDVAERLSKFNDGLPHTLAELATPKDPRVSFAVGFLLSKGVLKRARGENRP